MRTSELGENFVSGFFRFSQALEIARQNLCLNIVYIEGGSVKGLCEPLQSKGVLVPKCEIWKTRAELSGSLCFT